jgi:hypothetical protein
MTEPLATLYVIVVTVLAVARVTRFAGQDHLWIFVAFRRLMLKVPYFRGMFFYDDDNFLMGCAWCLGVWTSLVGVPIAFHYYPGDQPFALVAASVLACAHLVGFLAAIEPD